MTDIWQGAPDTPLGRYVRLIAEYRQAPEPPIKGPRYTQEDRDEVIQLHKQGMGTRSIAEELCLARATVMSWLREAK